MYCRNFLRTGMISVSRLPINQETLYLRILGRGETQSGAVQELLNLPQANPMRQKIAELLVSWRISIEIQEQLKKEDQEVFMALSQVYLEWKEATKQEGRLEGLQEGRQEEAANLVLRQLTRKLANLSETMVKRVKKIDYSSVRKFRGSPIRIHPDWRFGDIFIQTRI